ncbi:MAG: lysophospholipid acyltransferase family protein [Candidatus Nanopelagicales bacterium]
MLYWVLKWILVGPWLRVLFRPWVEGDDILPKRGSAIVASNHLSFSDSFFLALMMSRRITFLAKSDYFTGRGVKGLLTKAFFAGVGQVPIDRSSGRAAEAAIATGVRVLRNGKLLGIYPEGTRTADGRLYRGRVGVARMALEAPAPVIPVAMIGTYEIQPPGRIRPSLKRVGIRYGPALDFSRYEGMESDRYILRSITDEIVYSLMGLSGQEYVDIYASRAKQLKAQDAVTAAEPAAD